MTRQHVSLVGGIYCCDVVSVVYLSCLPSQAFRKLNSFSECWYWVVSKGRLSIWHRYGTIYVVERWFDSFLMYITVCTLLNHNGEARSTCDHLCSLQKRIINRNVVTLRAMIDSSPSGTFCMSTLGRNPTILQYLERIRRIREVTPDSSLISLSGRLQSVLWNKHENDFQPVGKPISIMSQLEIGRAGWSATRLSRVSLFGPDRKKLSLKNAFTSAKIKTSISTCRNDFLAFSPYLNKDRSAAAP